MTEGKSSRGTIRLMALGLVLVLGAYWAGSRWGERQPQKVEAVPVSFPEPKPGELLGQEAINVKIYSEAAPAVANIVTRTLEYDVFMEPVPAEGAGSGFVIDPRGYILTNFHVVQGAQAISVTLGDRSHFDAKFVGADERNDIALIKIDPKDRKLIALTMGILTRFKLARLYWRSAIRSAFKARSPPESSARLGVQCRPARRR